VAFRSWYIWFKNDTQFYLTKVDEDREDYTEWSPDPPPNSIAPYAEVDWKLDSAGTLTSGPRGVEGRVTYRIEDKDYFFGGDNHPGKQGCLFLHWNNPVIGTASFSGPPFFNACTSALGSSDPSSDYTIYRSYGMGGEGDKWTEWVLAAGIGPLYLWHSVDPSIFLTLRTKTAVISALEKEEAERMEASRHGFDVSSSLPEPLPLKLAPINSGTSDSWSRIWTNTFFKQKASILVTIRSGPVIVSGGYVRTAGGVMLPNFAESYIVDVTDKFSSINLHQENIITSPLIANPYKGEVWKREDTGMIVHSTHEIPALPITEATWIMGGDPRAVSSKDTPVVVTKVLGGDDGIMAITGVKADSMTLQNNITLQLYGDFNPAKKLVNFRVRYLRTGDGGGILEDVMLNEYHPIK